MNQLPPWSYTLLEAFEQCPRKAFHRYILKEKPPETEARRKGNEFDKAMEARVKTGTPLPPEYAALESFAGSIDKLKGKNCKAYTQLKMGITRNFEPCGFFADQVWGRGATDVILAQFPNATIIDWKTGKNSEGKSYSNDGLQLKIFALLAFKHFPRVDKITAFNVWLKTGELGKPYVFTRALQAPLWREVLPRVIRLEKMWETCRGGWPEQPGPLCGWCPVTQCQYNRS
jgi:hypothetical protein